jgi:hypothetical protein
MYRFTNEVYEGSKKLIKLRCIMYKTKALNLSFMSGEYRSDPLACQASTLAK